MTPLSIGTQLALAFAGVEAERLGSTDIDVEHLVIGACKVVDVAAPDVIDNVPLPEPARRELARERQSLSAAFSAAGFDATRARRGLRAIWTATNPMPGPFSGHRTARCKQLFEVAATAEPVDLSALFLAALDVPSPHLDTLFENLAVTRDRLRSCLAAPAATVLGAAASPEVAERAKSSVLRFGRNLTALARERKLPPTLGRNDEIKRVARILLQAKKANPLLVGDAGVGKTAIVEGLAQKLQETGAPQGLQGLQIIELSLGALVAGAKYRGDFEERMQSIIKHAEADRSLVLFIDEIHMLLGAGAGGGGTMDAANLLKPALARGRVRVIGATTTVEYRKHFEKDPALARRFQAIWIDEPGRDTAVRMLESLRPSFEQHHGVRIDPAAIARAVDLSIRYMPDLRLPDKAIDLIDQACARALLASFSPRPAATPSAAPATVDGDVIASVVAERCRVPVDQVAVDERRRLLQMEAFLEQRVIGQRRAIRTVADAIRTARTGLGDSRRPPAFLFAGPTGTGKTELAKAVAEFLFGDERRLIRIDLSEYGEKHTVARLIGSPPGYVGHDEGGQLTDPIRTHPYSVVLLDEVDKAHPAVLDVLLPLLDEGHLTDGQGRRARFSDAVVIMTSNFGTAGGGPPAIGFAPRPESDRPAPGSELDATVPMIRAEDEARVRTAIARALRPELLNRIPHVIVFATIGPAAGRAILDKILGQVHARLADRRVTLNLTPSACGLLLRHGLSEQFGAREMERAVDRLLVRPLGALVLKGKFTPGTTVKVEAQGDILMFQPGT